MSATPDNPPAFPTHHNVNDPRADGFHAEEGMTLRDWFAGKALPAYLAKVESGVYYSDDAVKDAYQTADAMLRARACGRGNLKPGDGK